MLPTTTVPSSGMNGVHLPEAVNETDDLEDRIDRKHEVHLSQRRMDFLEIFFAPAFTVAICVARTLRQTL